MEIFFFTAQCPPHYNSSTGLKECEECPKGYYQLEYGSVSCIKCSAANRSNESLQQCYGRFITINKHNYYVHNYFGLLFYFIVETPVVEPIVS